MYGDDGINAAFFDAGRLQLMCHCLDRNEYLSQARVVCPRIQLRVKELVWLDSVNLLDFALGEPLGQLVQPDTVAGTDLQDGTASLREKRAYRVDPEALGRRCKPSPPVLEPDLLESVPGAYIRAILCEWECE